MFRFRLAKVLRWRERRVDEEARAMRDAAEALRRARRERTGLESELARLARDGERRRCAGGDVAQWRLLATWLTAQHDRLRLLRVREREAAAALGAQRQRLLQAHREKEVLLRLEERQRQVWEEEERRRERRELDDIGGRRHAGADHGGQV
ncbi:MAG: flagellar export protein FliJ [Candidatus Krumholzibacteriia bacterium]